ncbi:MAG TPA: membrane protein insertase YidC [Acidobacteriota bacterium]|nr:membrane protein insertase YidC [Acidobacteriota bacterium]
MSEIQDPASQGSEWRVVLAVVLSMAVLFGFQLFIPQTPAPEQPPPEAVEEPQPAQPSREGQVEGSQPDETAQPGTLSQQGADEELPPTEAAPTEIVMENQEMRLVWSNRRASLISAELLNYQNDQGQPVQVLPQGLPEDATRPLQVRVPGGLYESVVADAVYEVEGAFNGKVPAGGELKMRFRRGAVDIERRVRIPREGYTLQVSTDVRVEGVPTDYFLTMGAGIGRHGPESGWQGDFRYPRVVYRSNSGLSEFAPGDLEEERHVRAGEFQWLAVDSLYFTYALLSGGRPFTGAEIYEANYSMPDAEDEVVETVLQLAEVKVPAGSQVDLYVGPKYPDRLALADPTLPELIDYGLLEILVIPLKWALIETNSFIHNYGFSIIILTFLINLILAPIRIKQVRSMKKMGELQPQMKAIQEKYKKMKRDDPRKLKMNEEVMALYKQHGVNPLGGCLPLLLQMPFLFAFYQMIAYSIELREASFMLWIHDLSRPDPYYITPLVMGASMVAQQAMSPSVGDSTQRKMMMFMPVVFTFFFLNVSSGLAIYFLFSNIFGLAFQKGFQALMPEEDKGKPSSKPKGPSKKSGRK